MVKELIEKLEAATAGSRELDYTIEHIVGQKPKYALEWPHPDDTTHYTTSIDAALTLVPNQFYWMFSKNLSHEYTAMLHDYRIPFDDGRRNRNVHTAIAKTPSIAICIAALKARLT